MEQKQLFQIKNKKKKKKIYFILNQPMLENYYQKQLTVFVKISQKT